MTVNETRLKILQEFLAHCNRSSHMPLGFLGVDDDVWECPSDPEHVAISLTEKFAMTELATSGIVVVDDSGSVTLTAALTGGAQFIALRDATTGEPFELLTGDGCVSPGVLPVFEILRDAHTQQCLEQGGGTLFVAFDIDDLVMLRACGLPTTLASGLEELPLEDVARFCKSFSVSCVKRYGALSHEATKADGKIEFESTPIDPFRHFAQMGAAEPLADSGNVPKATSPHSSGPVSQCRVQLVILGWTPSNLTNTVPCQLSVVVDYFRQLNRFMGVDLHDLQIWKGDEEAIERMRFIADRRSAALFREAVLDAADEAGADMMDFGQGKSTSLGRPADYPSALARLQVATSSDANSHSMGADGRKRAWIDVQKSLCQQVINPIREYALESGDPIERTLLMGIAELSQVFYMQTVQIGEQLSRQIAEPGVERAEPLPDTQFKHLLATTDRLINMMKARGQCTQPRTTFVQSTTIDAQNIPRLRRSG